MPTDPEESGTPRVRAAELTGELPQVVREALIERPAQRDQLDAADRETAEALVDLGVSRPDAEAAVREGRVPLVLTATSVGREPRHTMADLAEQAEIPESVLRDIRVALGMPLPERFTDRDLEWAQRIARLLQVVPPEAVVRSARARGSALTAVARADMALVRDELVLPMRKAGADDLTVSIALAETAKALVPLSAELLQLTYELALEAELNSELSAIAARADGHELDIAVGFVDVVGYTALSARIDPAGLDELLDAFEARVVSVLSSRPEVSVVKYLGDAVMLVAGDAAALARAMLELTAEVASLEDAPLRGGLAAGPVLVREGDYFGSPVNLAARLTDLARPWSLLADDDMQDRLAGDEVLDLRRVLPMRVRGVGLRRPLSVRRSAAHDGSGGG